MMDISARSSFYKTGIFAGYPEYRYGSGKKLETQKPPKAIFPRGKRKHLVSRLFNTMSDWRSSPFEFEGVMIHGIRSQLCLRGYGWAMADAEARFLVKATLRLIGIPRPNWNQGQPGYTDSPDRCTWCGNHLDGLASSKASRYCSDVCANAAFERRDFARRIGTDKAYEAARRMLSRARTNVRICEGCGSSFQPAREKSKQRFCSYQCSNKDRVRQGSIPGAHPTAVILACAFCGADFKARNKTATFCSKSCHATYAKLRQGKEPKLLRVSVFDHFITKPVNAMPRRLMPVVFDRLFEAA